jgi:hypothetical protein
MAVLAMTSSKLLVLLQIPRCIGITLHTKAEAAVLHGLLLLCSPVGRYAAAPYIMEQQRVAWPWQCSPMFPQVKLSLRLTN